MSRGFIFSRAPISTAKGILVSRWFNRVIARPTVVTVVAGLPAYFAWMTNIADLLYQPYRVNDGRLTVFCIISIFKMPIPPPPQYSDLWIHFIRFRKISDYHAPKQLALKKSSPRFHISLELLRNHPLVVDAAGLQIHYKIRARLQNLTRTLIRKQ